MLRGGWLGVDLVQEIAKAYLKPPAGEGGEAAGGREGGGKGAEQQAADGGGRGKGRRGRGGGDHGTAGRRAEGWDSASSRAGGESAKDGAAAAGTGSSGGSNGAGTDGGERSAGGAIQGQMERLRLALQQQQTGGNGRESGGEGGASGSSGARDSHRDTSNNKSGHRSSMASKNPRLSVSEGLLVDRGPNSNVETQSSGGSGAGSAFDDGGYSTESAVGEDQKTWEEGGEDLDSDEEVNFFESGGGTEGEDNEEEEELARAKAAAAAARARSEVALLREMETVHANQQGMGRPGEAVVIPPLGQHTRTVVTQAMPARFVEEVGASLASAMALATARMLIQACVNLRVKKKAEKVAFKDVVGCDEAKGEIKQIVDFLVDPSAYDSLGASRPKGILLVGPPGTGKTLIAKACAGEAGVPFLYACGSEFNGVYVGMGVAAVKRLFAKARKHKKSIIYIDEIDHLGRARGGSRDAGSATQDREATLNQLLSEMDGFEGKDGIVVMASTNRKDMLDDALLRSGRFDMQVDVDRPDRKGREQLFTKYLAPLKLSDEEREGGVEASPDSSTSSNGVFRGGRGRRYFGGGAAAAAAAAAEREKQEAIKKQGLQDDIAKELADMTPYMTGADVANVCATAGRIAARSGSDAVELEHFSAAVDRVQHGLEKPDREVTEDERKRTAIHEAGHAVAGWMLPWCDEVVKVSIVWRGNALGFSQTAVVERQSEMREMVLDSVCMTLAGRAAEEVLCGTISGGASSDLRVASRQLYSAITEVGFGSTTGLLSPGHRQLSEKVMAEIDQEVQTLLAQQYQRALALIRTHRDKIDSLSAALLEHNVVHKADLRRILGDKVTVESEEAAAAAALTEGLLKVDGEKAENASTSGVGTAPTEA
ncbi:unnamed protein product [Ectocarpus sp. 12 AP-2014]